MDLLFELYCEELPASYLDKAIEIFPEIVTQKLSELRLFRSEGEHLRVTGTPRRIVLSLTGLPREQRALSEELSGPPVAAAFKDGKPTKAAEAFAAKVGVPIERLEQRDTPKGKYLFGTKKGESRPTAAILPEALAEWIRLIEFPKTMVWVPGSKLRFPRPLRSIVALLGEEVVPFEWNGVRSGRTTWGHPFLAPGPVELRSAAFDEYERRSTSRSPRASSSRRSRGTSARSRSSRASGASRTASPSSATVRGTTRSARETSASSARGSPMLTSST
jgi:glycyl-tRNA synthetase beta chain